MSISVTPVPQYATPTRPPKLTFAATVGKKVKLFVANAPAESQLKGKLLAAGATRLLIHEGDVGQPFLFEADAPGAYSLLAQEIEVPQFRGGFQGDTRGMLDVGGGKGDEKVLSETSTKIYIGSRVTGPIGAGRDVATLVLWVWESGIRETSIDLHGEISPDIVGPASTVAATATNDTTVREKLAALRGADVNAALFGLSSFTPMIDAMLTQMNQHFTNNLLHTVAVDEGNLVPAAFQGADGKVGIPLTLAKVFDSLKKHIESDDTNRVVTTAAAAHSVVGADEIGPGSGAWHQVSGTNRADYANLPLVAPPSTMAECVAVFADLWRCYEGHRMKAPPHAASFDVHALEPLPPLFALHKAFLDVLAGVAPTAAPDENPGATLLAHAVGMTPG